MSHNRREMSNPHDKITIDYTDPKAAQVAVAVVGEGKYGIVGDDGMPIFLFGGYDEWCQKTHGMTFEKLTESVSHERIVVALESMRLEGDRSSMSDPVGYAHECAKRLREHAATSTLPVDAGEVGHG